MIKFYNRKTKEYEIEKVVGEAYLNWVYSSPIGMTLLELLIKKKLFSSLYGFYCSSHASYKKVASFIDEFNIDVSQSKKTAAEYKSFNDFFSRQLKSEARPIDMTEESFISPGDGRLLAYKNIDLESLIQVKGYTYSFLNLVEDPEVASLFKNGTCLIFRLCPTDYHRFHFVDSGTCSETHRHKGAYYSVNPIALSKISKIFCMNKREWSILYSNNFGEILYVEVGATCVGSIIQTYPTALEVKKGAEKGYFKFGGSTVIIFLQNGKVKIDKDILEQTKLGFETKVLMGEKIGEKK
jgi:phosphatidylserine decarboxylase